MCGRYVLAQDPDTYARFFGVEEVRSEKLAASYNVAPTDSVYAVLEHERRRLMGRLRWGLIPFWAETARGGHINARAETVAHKPVFRESFGRRRCILPADGFFEWQPMARGKLPHYIYRRDGSPLGLAGLWSSWRDPSTGARIGSCAIITTEAHRELAKIHGRMPVMLDPSVWDRWLDRALADPHEAASLLTSFAEVDLTHHPVSSLVNDVRNDVPECIAPLPDR